MAHPHRKIRVIFLLFYFEAWDSLAGIYTGMLESEDFEPIVATIPRKLTGATTYGDESLVHDFLENAGVEHIRLNGPDHEAEAARLKDLAPDYVFLNYPWQRNYPPAFRPDKLAAFTRICYVPYFTAPLVDDANDIAPGTQVAGHLFEQRMHQLASLVFVQDEVTRQAFMTTPRGADHVFAFGSPKLDSLRVEYANALHAVQTTKPKRIRKATRSLLWAPHHSYSTAWLGFGRFGTDYRLMLNIARRHPETAITLRPHPFMFGTLVDRGVLAADELESWIQEFSSLPNCAIEASTPFAVQFAQHDDLLTDGISFLAEYPLLTSRPAYFIESQDHWPFNSAGLLAEACNYKVKSIDEFEELWLANGRAAENSTKRDFADAIKALRAEIDPNAGTVSSLIIKAVRDHYAEGVPLVNPTQVTELPWEDRPGREPRDD